MAAFTDKEISYLESQRLGRVATVGPNGQPHVVPVGFRINHNEGTVDIAGYDMEQSRKYRNVVEHPKAALVVDDVTGTNPWQVRGVMIRGRAEATGGAGADGGLYSGPLIRIVPERITSWGLDE